MEEIKLSTAVYQIVDATRRRTSKNWSAYPFFFIIGAGVSHPPIPLAWEIEQICVKEIALRGLTLPSMPEHPLDRYQISLETLHPQPADRQAFLHEVIYGKRISTANYRLAHILGSQKLTDLVFTTNFDDMLARALRLLNHDVVVCDHPKTTQRVDLRRTTITQIIHVHGTYWFYDCINLRDEIENQAKSDLVDAATMGQLLDRALAERSPLVIGYSGWEGDVIMTALRRRLQHPFLPFNLYWFCFKRSDAQNLPEWLTAHRNVKVILPSPISEDMNGPNEALSPAHKVFEEFIRALDLKPPRLASDPLGFFVDLLEANLELEEDHFDLFSLHEALQRVRDGARLERELFQGKGSLNKEAVDTIERANQIVEAPIYSDIFHRPQKKS